MCDVVNSDQSILTCSLFVQYFFRNASIEIVIAVSIPIAWMVDIVSQVPFCKKSDPWISYRPINGAITYARNDNP